MLLTVIINLISVSFYGESQLWFSAVKVVTISVIVSGGLIIIFTGIGNGGRPAAFMGLHVDVFLPSTCMGYCFP